MEYTSSTLAAGFHRKVKLCIDKENVKINYYKSSMGMDKIDFEMNGKIMLKNPQYMLVKIIDINKTPYVSYLDIYVFENKNLTDDETGLTDINIANTPSYNTYFDCVIYVNNNMTTVVNTYDAVLNNYVSKLNNSKLCSNCNIKGGWSWYYNEETNKIVK